MKINFIWKGINKDGEPMTSEIAAKNKRQALQLLKANGHTILSIKKPVKLTTFYLPSPSLKKIRRYFLRDLALYLRSGLTISESLPLIKKNCTCTTLSNLLTKMIATLNSGVNFSNAIAQHNEFFPKTMQNAIAAGEKLDAMTDTIISIYKQEEKIKKYSEKIKKVLFYPTLLLIISILITSGILIFIMPQFNNIYESFHAKLPTITTALLHMSNAIRHLNLFMCFYVIIFTLVTYPFLKRNNWIVHLQQRILTHIPVINSLWLIYNFSLWCRYIADLMIAGHPFLTAMCYADTLITHPRLRQDLVQINRFITQGKSLTAALNICQSIPLEARQLMSVGDNTDHLQSIFTKLSTIYESRLNDQLEYLSKLLEPVMMIIIGSIITALLIAIYLPIFQMGNIV